MVEDDSLNRDLDSGESFLRQNWRAAAHYAHILGIETRRKSARSSTTMARKAEAVAARLAEGVAAIRASVRTPRQGTKKGASEKEKEKEKEGEASSRRGKRKRKQTKKAAASGIGSSSSSTISGSGSGSSGGGGVDHDEDDVAEIAGDVSAQLKKLTEQHGKSVSFLTDFELENLRVLVSLLRYSMVEAEAYCAFGVREAVGVEKDEDGEEGEGEEGGTSETSPSRKKGAKGPKSPKTGEKKGKEKKEKEKEEENPEIISLRLPHSTVVHRVPAEISTLMLRKLRDSALDVSWRNLSYYAALRAFARRQLPGMQDIEVMMRGPGACGEGLCQNSHGMARARALASQSKRARSKAGVAGPSSSSSSSSSLASSLRQLVGSLADSVGKFWSHRSNVLSTMRALETNLRR